MSPDLPDLQTLKEVRLQIPLRIYSNDGGLMAEIGEKKRIPLRLSQIPKPLIQAILAAEDDRFFDHPGVDWQGLTRAVLNLAKTGEKGQGGSTITMQVARNFYLSPEKSYRRKLKEILLALGIEKTFTKEEILELYLNKIYFGNRAYGVGAAAQVYYGLPVEELSLAQMATLAGLPKAPSRDNPIANPTASIIRRAYVLSRLVVLGEVDPATCRKAKEAPETARFHAPEITVNAPYMVEMVRSELVSSHGEEAYSSGFRVYTTLDPARQRFADDALREGLLGYEERHGYRGPEGHISAGSTEKEANAALSNYPTLAGLPAGRVIAVEGKSVRVQTIGKGVISLSWEGLSWARRHLSKDRLGPVPRRAADIVRIGDVVRIRLLSGSGFSEKWSLAQKPMVEGALISLDPRDAAILAVSGGYDFNQNKFNRATQAQRQPGSSFKPFVYSAGLARGYTPASVFDDAPLVINLPGADVWEPENYGGRSHGPTRLREALVHSLNLVSIRLLQAVGVDYAIEYATRFGFSKEKMPRNLTLVLGTVVASPLEMATAYSVFANGGYRVMPYFIRRIEDNNGALVFQAEPPTACPECKDPTQKVTPKGLPIAPRVIDPRNAYLMNSMLRDVVQRGTAIRAKSLGRTDVAGKTGTTNEERDTWFTGFNAELLTTVWMGYDHMEPLGVEETGGKTAVPVWTRYMAEALRGVPETALQEPSGLVTVRIDTHTGNSSSATSPDAIFETFPAEQAPKRNPTAAKVTRRRPTVRREAPSSDDDDSSDSSDNSSEDSADSPSSPEQLF